MGKYVFIICTLFLLGCADKFSIYKENSKSNGIENLSSITGVVDLTDGSQIDLGSISDKSLLIIFATDTCTVCLEETKEINDFLELNGGAPSNVEIITILIGATKEDAQDWKEFNPGIQKEVPWRVGYDFDLVIYKKYFNQITTPTAIAKKQGQAEFSYWIGKRNIEQIQKETGIWLF